MKRAVTALLLMVCTGSGCMNFAAFWEMQKMPAAQPPRARPPVTAEQITDRNAHEMADALFDELDREAQGDTLPSLEKPDQPAKPAEGNGR